MTSDEALTTIAAMFGVWLFWPCALVGFLSFGFVLYVFGNILVDGMRARWRRWRGES